MHLFRNPYPAGNYMFKVNNKKTRIRCEICSELRLKTPERRHYFLLFLRTPLQCCFSCFMFSLGLYFSWFLFKRAFIWVCLYTECRTYLKNGELRDKRKLNFTEKFSHRHRKCKAKDFILLYSNQYFT